MNSRGPFQASILAFASIALLGILASGVPATPQPSVRAADIGEESGPAILNDQALRNYVQAFNDEDHTHFGQAISNEAAADWMAANVPRFECPDKEIEEICTPTYPGP